MGRWFRKLIGRQQWRDVSPHEQREMVVAYLRQHGLWPPTHIVAARLRAGMSLDQAMKDKPYE